MKKQSARAGVLVLVTCGLAYGTGVLIGNTLGGGIKVAEARTAKRHHPKKRTARIETAKKMRFIIDASALAEGKMKGLQQSNVSKGEIQRIERKVRLILSDISKAAGEGPGYGRPSCSNCYTNYLRCTLDPTICIANYSNCLNTCSG